MGQEHLLPLPRWTIIVHSVQILVAVLILGLDAYGIKYIPYNALIFSLVTVRMYFSSSTEIRIDTFLGHPDSHHLCIHNNKHPRPP